MDIRPDIYYLITNEAVKQDLDVLKVAISKKLKVLQYSPSSLKNDREFVMECIKIDGSQFEYIDSHELLNDKELILESIKTFGNNLKYLNNFEINLLDHCILEVIKLGLKQNGLSLQYINNLLNSLEYTIYRNFILIAVKSNGESIQFGNDEIKKDFEVVLESVKQSPSSFEYIDNNLKKEKLILLEYLNNIKELNYNSLSIEIIDTIKSDEELLYSALLKCEEFLAEPHPELANEQFMLKLMSNSRFNISSIPKKFTNMETVMLKSLDWSSSYFEQCCENLKSNKNFLLKCLEKHPILYTKLPLHYKSDRELLMMTLEHARDKIFTVNGETTNTGFQILESIPSSFFKDRQVLLACAKSYFFSLIIEEKFNETEQGEIYEICCSEDFVVEYLERNVDKVYVDKRNFLDLVENWIGPLIENENLLKKILKVYPTYVRDIRLSDELLESIVFK